MHGGSQRDAELVNLCNKLPVNTVAWSDCMALANPNYTPQHHKNPLNLAGRRAEIKREIARIKKGK